MWDLLIPNLSVRHIYHNNITLERFDITISSHIQNCTHFPVQIALIQVSPGTRMHIWQTAVY
jgi:hypothetical protein